MNKKNNILKYTQLKKHLNFNDIPGWSAQKEMAPPYRQNLVDKARYDLYNPKIAAVLILIYEKDNELYVPLIHRNTHTGIHSNQIGFPGGKIEPKDKNLQETAIRESYEEINTNPNNVKILGVLTKLFIPPSNYMVYPFVGYYNGVPNFIPSDKEVKSIIHINLNDFIKNPKSIQHPLYYNNKLYNVPAFQLKDNFICWGATAMMLNEFIIFLRNSLNL